MAQSSSIEWTEATWNPTTGCDRISAGCDNCYALKLAGRLKAMGQARYQVDGNEKTSGPGFGVTLHPDSLDAPLRWTKPRIIFVNSMSDLFHARVPISYIREVFATIRKTPQHTYQVLTKRSLRMARVAGKLDWPPNLWMGVSVESSDQLQRMDHLRSVPAVVRFISAEPLLGPLNEIDLHGIQWVIAGGESGFGARPVAPEWIRDLRDASRAANIPFFFKQWGGRTPKAGGRSLDGREWSEYPQVRSALAV
ncbi:phage Gp37/Gp68 family protein [Amycolatopsis sp. K13G38]|uniref:Phage Gp37/Gp68 family protein n=1 Tax=Amycolatopsis acididurans TaxID=2724524 RepID=A0ABX1J587_9PSEU|nr:phage Gp37/Gp68 family protein [Amycolatopsis acididurans]NKQ54975.1 phage Gp37/Gp68 family protein [Amycolatopsis acididurans]